MLRDVQTKQLVEELSKRQGVNTYKGTFNSLYKIEVVEHGLGEISKATTIKEDSGPAIILEVID